MTVATCSVCGREISTRAPGVFEKVTGYVSTNGAKGFRTDEHLGKYVHERCIEDAKRGINVAQESLAL